MIDYISLYRFLVLYLSEETQGLLCDQANLWDGIVPGRWNDRFFRESFAGATRRFGRTPLQWRDDQLAALNRLGVTWALAATRDELSRIALLAAAASKAPEAIFQSLVQKCYDEGDTRERQSVLRALPVLPEAERFLPIALETCRSHILPLFEAMACDNPYPSAYFPSLHMNQMVLRALGMETPLRRIVGLERRMTSELTRMADDYVKECRAAGRAIPGDVWQLFHLASAMQNTGRRDIPYSGGRTIMP